MFISRLAAIFIAASLFSMPCMIGCDKELSHTEKTTTDTNGNKSTTDEKTVKHPDGSVTTEKQTNNQNP